MYVHLESKKNESTPFLFFGSVVLLYFGLSWGFCFPSEKWTAAPWCRGLLPFVPVCPSSFPSLPLSVRVSHDLLIHFFILCFLFVLPLSTNPGPRLSLLSPSSSPCPPRRFRSPPLAFSIHIMSQAAALFSPFSPLKTHTSGICWSCRPRKRQRRSPQMQPPVVLKTAPPDQIQKQPTVWNAT